MKRKVKKLRLFLLVIDMTTSFYSKIVSGFPSENVKRTKNKMSFIQKFF